jgi:anti-sigma factor RsiW
MSGHVSEWLAAYYDGELHGPRRGQIEEHLETCPACQAELEELHELSALLQEAPAAEPRLSPRQFRSQVILRLPPASHRPGWQRTLKTGWGLAPLGAVAVWVFGQAVWLIASLGSILSLPLGSSRAAALGGWLNPIGSVPLWRGVERALMLGLFNLVFTAMVTLFLLGWLASWWLVARRPSQNEVGKKINTRTQ